MKEICKMFPAVYKLSLATDKVLLKFYLNIEVSIRLILKRISGCLIVKKSVNV